ncbi:MAG: alpha/beta fold hydrolase [Gemmatimonadaceae bacterium]
MSDVRFPADSGVTMSGLLYTPETATPDHRAPAVLASHGYINTREMQSAFAIELSRRGIVVLAMDMTGHGYSEGKVGAQNYGGPAAFRYLKSLPNVDTTNIGLEAHSMGGGPILAVAAKYPNGYRSMVLEGSAPGVFGKSLPLSTTFPKNTAFVFGQYDEFATLMWQSKKGSEIGGSKKMKALFGTTDVVLPNVPSGLVDSGTARMFYSPAVTHPIEHFSNAGVGDAIDWFQRTLKGIPSPRDPNDQIWKWKELGTLVAFVGFVLLMLGAFDALLQTPWFASLRGAPVFGAESRSGRWWASFVLTAALPALTFYPFMRLGSMAAFKPTRVFPQGIMNQLVVWALLNAVLSLIVGAVVRAPGATRERTRPQWGKSIVIASITIAVGYASLAIVQSAWHVDYRFWVVGLKAFDAIHFHIALVYLVPWTLFFLVAMHSLNRLSVRGDGWLASYSTAKLAMAGGFGALLVVQYGSLFTTGVLFSPKESLNTIIAIQFLPLLATIGLIGAFMYRRTGSSVPGALVCAMWVTWYVAAGTAIHA